MTKGSAGRDPVDVVAQAWLTKMRGEEAAAVREEFEEWLEASPDHRRAYERIERLMAGSAVLKTSARHGTARGDERQRETRRWLPLGAAAAAAALLILAIGVGGAPVPGITPVGSPAARATERLVTARGEIRTFPLADGSSVTLDTDSRAEFIDADRRPVLRLMKGRARVSRASEGGALLVEAGKAVFRVKDAEFDISIDAADSTLAAVRRGSVSFGPAAASTTTPLVTGRRFAFGPDGRMLANAQPPEMTTSDWPSGWAEHRSIQLDKLLTEANRYAETPIMLDDRSLASVELSGRFHVGDTEAFVRRIAEMLDLSVERSSAAIQLRRR